MKINSRALVLAVGCLCFPEWTNLRSGKILAGRVPAVDCSELIADWRYLHHVVPDDVTRFRFVIVHQHGAEEPRLKREPRRHTIYTGKHWRRNGIAPCSVPHITS
jgi:hypothetical protein